MDAPARTRKPAEVSIEDVQNRADTRRIPINRVGVKDVYHPVRLKDRSGGEQHTIANFNMYVNLPHDFKGTHMLSWCARRARPHAVVPRRDRERHSRTCVHPSHQIFLPGRLLR